MKRRDFFKQLFLTAAVITVTPEIISKKETIRRYASATEVALFGLGCNTYVIENGKTYKISKIIKKVGYMANTDFYEVEIEPVK